MFHKNVRWIFPNPEVGLIAEGKPAKPLGGLKLYLMTSDSSCRHKNLLLALMGSLHFPDDHGMWQISQGEVDLLFSPKGEAGKNERQGMNGQGIGWQKESPVWPVEVLHTGR